MDVAAAALSLPLSKEHQPPGYCPAGTESPLHPSARHSKDLFSHVKQLGIEK